jgi:hypothetical protein
MQVAQSLKIETKLGLVEAAIKEDRAELRLLKDRIYSICSWITISSFAVTSFLFTPTRSKVDIHRLLPLLPIIDFFFIVLMLVIFRWLKRDLEVGHRCLEAREQLIGKLQIGETDDPFTPYIKVDMKKPPNMREDHLYVLTALCSLAIFVKCAVIYWWLSTAPAGQ